MLDEIGTIDNADPWIRAAVERGDRLMGFGHRVYKIDDPRSVMLRSVAERLGGPKLELAEQVEQLAVEILAELKPGRKLYTNVEFYAGIVMDACGVPRDMFTPTFASSRRDRLVARTSSSRPPTTASSGPAPTTPGRPHPSPSRPPTERTGRARPHVGQALTQPSLGSAVAAAR